MTQKEYYEDRLKEIDRLHNEQKYTACVRECGLLFETALREHLQNLLQQLEAVGERDEILAAERKLAKGGESFKRFSLGQLVGLYREANVFDKLRKHLTSSLSKVRRIIWTEVVELRNIAIHNESAATIDEEDSFQMCLWLKTFLHDTELIGTSTEVKSGNEANAPSGVSYCPECKSRLLNQWKFCPECGTGIYQVCQACFRALSPEFKICPYCETPIRGGAAANPKALHDYEMICRGVYFDQIVNARERVMLDRKRLELGLSVAQAEEIERRCVPRNIALFQELVEGLLLDGEISDTERAFLEKKASALNIDPELAASIEEETRKYQQLRRKGAVCD